MNNFSSFNFLEKEFVNLYNHAKYAENFYYVDNDICAANTRKYIELIINTIIHLDNLHIESNDLFNKIEDLFNFKKGTSIVDNQDESRLLLNLFHNIREIGNNGTHAADVTDLINDECIVSDFELNSILVDAYEITKWFYFRYVSDAPYDTKYTFPNAPQNNTDTSDLENEISLLKQKLDAKDKEVNQFKELVDNFSNSEDEQQKRKQRSSDFLRRLDLDEKQTREQFIDVMLRNAGWECDTTTITYSTTRPEKGRNIAIAEWPCGDGFADYALFIGLDLVGIVEAKAYNRDISSDLQQAKGYAQDLNIENSEIKINSVNGYKVPFIYSSNGRPFIETLYTKSGVWFLDLRNNYNQSRALNGFHSPEGIKYLLQFDIEAANDRLRNNPDTYLTNSDGLNLYYYQLEAVQAVQDKILNKPNSRKALLVMATGTGKTRTITGLIYKLIKASRFKRILFLTDRKLLATQAADTMKNVKIEEQQVLEKIYKISEITNHLVDEDVRVKFATVQSMIKRVFHSDNPIPIDAYDCIVVDEAHRGYILDREFNEEDILFKGEKDYIGQYKKLLFYFDAWKIGLTATPAPHTTEIFGKSVYDYSYRKAVIDGNLVDHEPPYVIKTRQNSEGVTIEQGSEITLYNPETNEFEVLENEGDEIKVNIDDFNTKVLTPDFNNKVCEQLAKVLPVDTKEKTLIFAARDNHADEIVTLLKHHYENNGVVLHNDAIIKITGSVKDNEELTKKFKNEEYPKIVVTVDLLSTGVDIPQICNIVFLRQVKSRILYEQMIGRATRLCNEINKQFFRIYDAVNLYENMKAYSQMKSVANPKVLFEELVEALHCCNSEDKKPLMMQMIAKLQAKKRLLNSMKEDQLEDFKSFSNGKSPDEILQEVKDLPEEKIFSYLETNSELWNYLDHFKLSKDGKQLVVNEEDEYYGTYLLPNGKLPKDYIESFKEYITNNINNNEALKLITTKPYNLDRKSLKELKYELIRNGFSETMLNRSWSYENDVEIATDIIAFIRTLSLGSTLISKVDRVKNAMIKLKEQHTFNKKQLLWLEKIEKQMIHESILQKEDLNNNPFNRDGGFVRINKEFDDRLESIIEELNTNLFSA